LISGTSAGSTIEWTPEDGTLPTGLTARVAFSPNVGGKNAADNGGSGVQSGDLKSGWDVTLDASSEVTGVDGLNIFGGISNVDRDQTAAAVSGNREEKTIGATYAMGGFTFGYQWSEEETGNASGTTKYENDAYGVTFSVNDDLSIGYNNYESTATGGGVTLEADSIQLAYTMGGASIRLAEADVDNQTYGSGTNRSATTVSVSLAF